MFAYSRKVTFIDLYVNGIKCGSVGVLKQQLTEMGLRLFIELCGMEQWEGKICPVYLMGTGGKKNLADIQLKGGKGQTGLDIPMDELIQNQYNKLFLHPAENSYAVGELICVPEEAVQNKNGKDAKTQEETIYTISDEKIQEEIKQEEIEQFYEEQECDKWEQIKKKYPILYPFKGQGPYVSIKPVDLQLLKSSYHNLNNNTFLMHGFYRYRHMILGEYSMDKGTFFYIGVPGEFVKKEQSTAAMCGFEGYEHSGDLGYYLYRVEI